MLLGNLAFIVICAALKTKSLFSLVVSEQVSKDKKGVFSCNFVAQSIEKPGGPGWDYQIMSSGIFGISTSHPFLKIASDGKATYF